MNTKLSYQNIITDYKQHKISLIEACNKFKEATEEQLDLFDPEISTFYNDGDEAINVIRNKDNTKSYVFDQESSDYVNGLIPNPEDTSYVVSVLADAFNNNDEFANILKNANRDDKLVFNTSKDGKIIIPMDDLFSNSIYQQRMDRFKTEEAIDDDENSDWMMAWKASKFDSENI